MAHLGNNIAKLRGFRRLTQKQMAYKLNISQQDYSKLEMKEMIEDNLLQEVAEILDFPVELIKQLDSSNSAYSFNQQGGNTGSVFYQYPPEDLKALYEQIIKEKDSIIKAKEDLIRQKDEIIQMYQKQKAS